MDKVRLGLLYSRLRLEEKLLVQATRRRDDVELVLLNTGKLVLDFERLPAVDVVLDRELSQSRALHVLNVLDRTDVATVNTFDAARVGGDKVLTSKRLHNAGVPTPRVKVAFTPESALAAVEAMGYPVVLKPVDGSWGRYIAKLESRTAAEAVLEHKAGLSSYFHGIFYLQEYVEKPERDIRAFVIDGETVGASYRTSAHWRTNAARGAKTLPCAVTPELDDLCRRACAAVGGTAIAVDLMETPDGFTVHEVNCAMEFKTSLPAMEVDLPGKLIDCCVRAGREARRVRASNETTSPSPRPSPVEGEGAL